MPVAGSTGNKKSKTPQKATKEGDAAIERLASAEPGTEGQAGDRGSQPSQAKRASASQKIDAMLLRDLRARLRRTKVLKKAMEQASSTRYPVSHAPLLLYYCNKNMINICTCIQTQLRAREARRLNFGPIFGVWRHRRRASCRCRGSSSSSRGEERWRVSGARKWNGAVRDRQKHGKGHRQEHGVGSGGGRRERY